MMAGERNTLAKVRCHVRPCQLAFFIELERMTLARTRRDVLHYLVSRFSLRQGLITIPVIIPNRTIIGFNLGHFIVRMTGFALRRQHVLNPVFDVNNTGFFGPVTL
ncbi:MAG: hypothetical protein QGG38_06915, partial [Nitrospinaceae bacterium]|nr:hypothetical protein [Nitrospinaceae bacterium]